MYFRNIYSLPPYQLEFEGHLRISVDFKFNMSQSIMGFAKTANALLNSINRSMLWRTELLTVYIGQTPHEALCPVLGIRWQDALIRKENTQSG